jgi:hypothetical protein
MASSHLKLALTYDVQRLHQELKHCLNKQWPLHFNNFDYEGDWRSISLRSASGNVDDIFAHSGDLDYVDTPLMAEVGYIRSVVNSWKCKKESVRLLALSPGSIIKPHKDRGCSYQDGSFRIHVPILTNKSVHFTVDGNELFLDEGTCWYMDFGKTHHIENRGETNRVHLIMDCIRNEWTDALFRENAYDFEVDPIEKERAKATRLLMMAELEKMNTDVARAIIAKIKSEEV